MWFDNIYILWNYGITERSPPIEEVIQSGVVPRFVEFLVREDFPQLQVCMGFFFFFFVVCNLCGGCVSSFVVFAYSFYIYIYIYIYILFSGFVV